MTEQVTVSESKALDAFREAEERFHDSRRRFFKLTGMGAAAIGTASAAWPGQVFAYGGPYAQSFVLDDSVLYMNIGTTGSTPREVLKNLDKNNTAIAKDPLGSLNTQAMRNTIAAGFGADPNEIVISFNTTDGMSKIMAGLDLPAGSEIISTNMEHPGGNGPMAINADRDGLVIKRVNLPTSDFMNDNAVLQRFMALQTANTKAIVFSSPPYLTGVRLNEKQLCAWAASQGIISIIDGAHTPGMINLNFHDMGVDFFAGSGHKWQCGPGQTGIMYVRNGMNSQPYQRPDLQVYDGLTNDLTTKTLNLPAYSNTTALPKFFATVSSQYGPTTPLYGGARNPAQNVAATLMSIGNPSYPALKAVQEVCSMWDAWGRQNIENYVVALAQYLRARLVGIWGPLCLSAGYSPNLQHYARSGLTGFNPFSPGYDFNAVLTPAQATAQTTASNAAVAALRTQGIVVRNTNCPHSLRSNALLNADPTTTSHPLRISTHLFHRSQDVDKLVNGLLAVVPHP